MMELDTRAVDLTSATAAQELELVADRPEVRLLRASLDSLVIAVSGA